MKWLVLVPFTEMGYYKLAEFLRKSARGVPTLLPIPRTLCREGYVGVGYVPPSLIRVWKPVLDLVDSGEVIADCYLESEDLEENIDTAVKIALLVLKARVYGKVDVSEWLSLLPRELGLRVVNWNGLLVIDRFVNYLLLTESRVNVDRLIAVDLFAPTPLDLLILVAKNFIKWKCSLLDVVNWVIKYIGDVIVNSRDLTEAYAKLIRDSEYRELITNCAPEEYVLYWWMAI